MVVVVRTAGGAEFKDRTGRLIAPGFGGRGGEGGERGLLVLWLRCCRMWRGGFFPPEEGFAEEEEGDGEDGTCAEGDADDYAEIADEGGG